MICLFASFPLFSLSPSQAIQWNYRALDDLASVYCAWAEMHLRARNFERALTIVQGAVIVRAAQRKRVTKSGKKYTPVQDRLYRSIKLWSLYVDLEESLGTLDTVRAAYDRAMELKVATAKVSLSL